MPSVSVPEAFVAISAATAFGVLTLASVDDVFPGAKAWIQKDNDSIPPARVLILSVDTTNKLATVRRYPNDNDAVAVGNGHSNMTAYATGSHLCQERQVAPIDRAYSKRNLP